MPRRSSTSRWSAGRCSFPDAQIEYVNAAAEAVAARMTREDFSEAQRLAREWSPEQASRARWSSRRRVASVFGEIKKLIVGLRHG